MSGTATWIADTSREGAPGCCYKVETLKRLCCPSCQSTNLERFGPRQPSDRVAWWQCMDCLIRWKLPKDQGTTFIRII
jgi:hypothetical protein